MNRSKSNELSISLRNFFHDYLPRQKGASIHTVHSYRDSIKLLLIFLVRDNGNVNGLSLKDLNTNKIISFLDHLESERHNSIGTRNIRLAAIHSFFRYASMMFPEHLDLCRQILSIPFKRMHIRAIEYLEFEELTTIFDQVDRSKPNGRRDYALLSLMFNTGARVQEIVDLKANDLHLSRPFSVHLFGKGRKERTCPLWTNTARLLHDYVEEQNIDLNKPETLFKNHLGTPLTRFGVRYILQKYINKALQNQPSLKTKRLHPHSMRHSTAIHLLKSGVDLVSIANWLGHACINTTNKYAVADFEMKQEAINKAAQPSTVSATNRSWKTDHDILRWLESL